MTRQEELALIYIEFHHLKIVAGDNGCADIFYPFLLMDEVYSIYQKEIVPAAKTSALKHIKRRWSDAYNRFNKRFFAPYTTEQRDEIVDMMDGYSDYIHNAAMTARVAVMDAIAKDGKCPFNDQMVLSACVMCNILAQCADIVWHKIFLNRLGEGQLNLDIVGVSRYARDFADEYMRIKGNYSYIRLNEHKGVQNAVDALVQKLLHYIKNGRTD